MSITPRHRAARRLVLLGASALLVACAPDETETGHVPQAQRSQQTPGAQDARYIVVFHDRGPGLEAVRAAGGRVVLDLGQRSAAAVYLSPLAAERLGADPRIVDLEPDPPRYPIAENTPYGIAMVQADQVPPTPPSGDAGRIRVCVIDSGLSAAHEDLADLAPFVTSTPNSGTGNPFLDQCGHGTHVTGTLAASQNALGVVGVGPAALSVHVVKVFDGADCGWAYSSSLVAALDACVAAGARVINMSLGGSIRSRFEEAAFAEAFDVEGVLPVAAAGNDGTTRRSFPASYPSVVSVAAIDEGKVVASFSQRNKEVELSAPGVNVLSTVPFRHQLTVDGQVYSASGIEFAAEGTGTGPLVDGGRCLAAGGWQGAVVLCERGDISFYDKVSNVQAGGGVAAVIYNSEPGGFQGTLGAGNTSAIPAIGIPREDGLALVAGGLGLASTVESGSGDGYAAWSGTSMATPHVAGVAALVWSQDPSWTNLELREALTVTAEDLGIPGRDDAYGFGLVRAAAALAFLQGGGPVCEPTESVEVTCDDGIDNDCDGDIDAADADCAAPPVCVADGQCNPDCAAGADPDCAAPTSCGNGTCDAGESCDGRAGTVSCPSDCDGRIGGKPSLRFCFVGGACEGPGCP